MSRRPSTALSQPIIGRNFSSTSTATISTNGESTGTEGGAPSKKRARALLRDYYGLSPSGSSANLKTTAGDSLDIDSPDSFDPDAYFKVLVANASVKDLLRKESELVNDIRELDAERQSLVYNHHHELIDASDTIRKMRSRALALDGSLDSLRSSFSIITQLTSTLSTPAPLASTSTLSPAPASPTSPTSSNSSTKQPPILDPLLHLPALLSLPVVLRTVSKSQADSLWGKWEPAIRSWEEEGVRGAKEVGGEARESLRSRRGGES